MKCFDMNYIYFGTGRWFFKLDEPGQNVNDVERLYGIRIDECLADGAGHCSLNNAHSSADICTSLDQNAAQNIAWTLDTQLEPIGGGYFKERTITDPTVTDYDMVFFTTTQPTDDLCGFGGRSRVWALNCATGGNIWTGGCDNATQVEAPNGAILLQLSGGNIEQFGTDEDTFSQEDNTATDWFVGIPPETSTPFVPPTGGGGATAGSLLLWLER